MEKLEALRALGREVERLRELRDWDQAALARAIRRSQAYVSGVEKAYVRPGAAEPSVPKDVDLKRFADALQVSVTHFHKILGRLPEDAVTPSPNATRIAVAYDNAPAQLKRIFESAADFVLEGGKELVEVA